MCILADHEIMTRLQKGELKIDNFYENSLTPNGYDLRIAEIAIPSLNLECKEGKVAIPPKQMFYVSTIERVELPNDLAAQLWLRTSWIRKGILAGLGKVDAGFAGTLTFMGYNVSDQEIELNIADRFVQIIFETLHAPASLSYGKRSGNYQGQEGITLSPLNKV
ncbi:dCTP deaminase [Candidatus Methanomassiliicoccus intestinalis]|uniref:dCTP deaminase n=2 Tax=Candidatus Methanomassiliicoccus intestinalis TaxID=1406512 RepID=UPI0037DCD1CE